MSKLAEDEATKFLVDSFMSAAQGLAVMTKDDVVARNRLAAYARFLLGDPKYRVYEDLADFLEWYGIKYLLPPVRKLVHQEGLDFRPFLEFGPGRGWLVGGLAHEHRQSWAIDKRKELYWSRNNVTFLEADLEKSPPLNSVHPESWPSDIIILANHFLHCLDSPEKIVKDYGRYPWIVIEPVDGEIDMPYWHQQMNLFGARAISDDYLVSIFDHAHLARRRLIPLPGQNISYFTPFR